MAVHGGRGAPPLRHRPVNPGHRRLVLAEVAHRERARRTARSPFGSDPADRVERRFDVPPTGTNGDPTAERVGVVAAPLTGGLALLTREDLVVQRACAARLGTGHSALLTVAISVRAGGFLVGEYVYGAAAPPVEAVHAGQELAAALAWQPLYGGDLRLWLSWPAASCMWSNGRRL